MASTIEMEDNVMSEPMFPIEEDPPKFKNMPKTRVFVTQSWKNIWYTAQDSCQMHLDRDPTREEIIELFDNVIPAHPDMDDWDEDGGYAEAVGSSIDEYYEKKAKQAGS